MSRQKKTRGVCVRCGYSFALRVNGRIQAHKLYPAERYCEGGGELPKRTPDEVERELIVAYIREASHRCHYGARSTLRKLAHEIEREMHIPEE